MLKSICVSAALLLTSGALADTYIDVQRQDATQIHLNNGENQVQFINFKNSQHVHCSFLRGQYVVEAIQQTGAKSAMFGFDLNNQEPSMVGFDFYIGNKGASADAGMVTAVIQAKEEADITLVCAAYSAEKSDDNNQYLGALHRIDQAWEQAFDTTTNDGQVASLYRLNSALRLVGDAHEGGFNTQSKAAALIASQTSTFLENIFAIFNKKVGEGGMQNEQAYFQSNKNNMLAPFRAFFKNTYDILNAYPVRAQEKTVLLDEFRSLIDMPINGQTIRENLKELKAGVMLQQIQFIEAKLS